MESSEIELINLLDSYPDILKRSAKSYSPHFLAVYSYRLASSFNKFYETSSLIKADSKELQKTRLELVKSFEIVATSCLNNLGIDAVNLM